MSTLALSTQTNSDDENTVEISEQNIEEGALFVSPLPNASTKSFEKSLSLIEKPNKKMSYSSADLSNISRHLSEDITQSNNTAKQNYEDLVTCSVCMDVFDNVNQLKFPKVLPCQHTYCVQCIKSIVHCSNDKSLTCPQCKYKVSNVLDANSFPNSRIVLALLEKESLNYQGYASCPCCRQIRNLEVCFECNLPLCNQCIGKHFETWKNEISNNCLLAEETLETFRQKIDVVSPLVTQNFESVQGIKDSIEEAFSLLFQRLNTEKEMLMKSVNEIKENNAKYLNFKKEILGLIASFRVFRESNETFEKKAMNSRIKKCQQQFDQVQKYEKEYTALSSTTFKLLERFERHPLPEINYNISGNLIISEMNLEPVRPTSSSSVISSRPSAPLLSQAQNVNSPKVKTTKVENQRQNNRAPNDHSRNTSVPTLGRSSGGQLSTNLLTTTPKPNPILNTVTNGNMLSKWSTNSLVRPQSEVTLSYAVTLVAAHENLLFCLDAGSILTIYEKVNSAELKVINSLKLNIPNIRAIAVNSQYVAVAYSSLKKEQLKGTLKNKNPSGIFLYRREQHVVCSVYEKEIELGKNECFKTINGLALTDKYLLVCEKETNSVHKFDIKNNSIVNSVQLDGEPFSISANHSYFCVIDAANSYIFLLDNETLETISSACIKDIDQLNGQMTILLTEENLIFIRNSSNQIALLNEKLEYQAYFNEIQAKLISMTLVKDTNHMLVIACQNSKQQFKLMSYIA